MDADYNRIEYVSLDHVCDWTSYYMHHSYMDALQYVYVDVLSSYFWYWMFYYTPHSYMGAHQYVYVDVFSSYFWY